MSDKTLDLTVELAPRARFDLVDLRRHFAAEHEALAGYPRCLYWSCHTTAGFLEPALASRLSAQHIPTYLEAFRTLFPEGAGYEHDRLERRDDLDSAQKAIEPRNADSHLAFMASGLRTCVTQVRRPLAMNARCESALRGSTARCAESRSSRRSSRSCS